MAPPPTWTGQVGIHLNVLGFRVPGNYSAKVLVLTMTILYADTQHGPWIQQGESEHPRVSSFKSKLGALNIPQCYPLYTTPTEFNSLMVCIKKLNLTPPLKNSVQIRISVWDSALYTAYMCKIVLRLTKLLHDMNGTISVSKFSCEKH